MTEPPENVTPIRPGEGFAGRLKTAAQILKENHPPLHWNIDGILPAGTLLLFGRPKKGKSFLALMFALSVAAKWPVFGRETSGKRVLYLGLEDSERRLQRRLTQCAESLGIPPSEFGENMDLSTKSKRLDKGLIDELRGYLVAFENVGLVVIDMLKMVTPPQDNRKPLYEQQAEVGHALAKLCHQYPHLSILVVHHSRKMVSDDPFDQVSGTTGLSGSYDSLAAIADSPGCRVLHITGRDVESAEIPLLMTEGGMYTLELPSPEDIAAATMSDSRRAVFEAIPSTMPMERADILKGCKLDDGTVDQQLRKLKASGLIKQAGRGKYIKTGKRWFEEIGGGFEGAY